MSGRIKASSRAQLALFERGARLQMDQSIDMTIASLEAYGERYRDWSIAYSGGKDSTSLVTIVVWLILSGKVRAPRTLRVLYADTRQELLPLAITAERVREKILEHAEALAAMGCRLTFEVVMALLDKRFLVYMLGRGVPPPNNNTLRWCTEQIKIQPMKRALERVAVDLGFGEMVAGKRGALAYQGNGSGKLLVLTGVRQGESAIRDGRIAMSCGRNGAECGQGWYQETLPGAVCDTLAPLLHWRVCHVWAWLWTWAPEDAFGDWPTKLLAEAYGGRDGDDAAESQARTGCNGCPLAEKDTALDGLVAMPQWAYLAPLKRLRPLYRRLREPVMRLRMPGGEKRKDGKLSPNQNRMGPLKLDARLVALEEVLAIQAEVNVNARAHDRPLLDILNAEEEARVRELVAAGTWPNKWSGSEPGAEEDFEEQNADGSAQPLLFGLEET